MSGPDPKDIEGLAQRILALPPAPLRLRIAVAGPPGAGKSTLAEALVERLNRDAGHAALVPMDGFHLDNRLLEPAGLLPRKGAPETFDAAGFLHMIDRLGHEPELVLPVFDRSRDIAIAGAARVTAATRIAVVEGNYLLLDEAPWDALRRHWDLSVFLDVPEDELTRRLIQRWRDHDLAPAEAEARARSNDIPNAHRILANSAPAHIALGS